MPGGAELIIILVIALLLFGGSRLAGVGKGMGRSIREFKQEVRSVDDAKAAPEVVDAEIINPINPNSAAAPSVDDFESRSAAIEARERELRAREDELRRQREAGL